MEYTALGTLMARLVLNNLPLVLVLGVLGTAYIANAHYAERQIRTIQALSKEVKELRRQYNALKAEAMLKSHRTNLEEEVARIGLSKDASKPRKIVVGQEVRVKKP